MNRIRRFSESLLRSPSKDNYPLNFVREDEADPIQLHLNGCVLSYENRTWLEKESAGSPAFIKDLQDRNHALEAENQLLKFKLGVMLDMMATTKLDCLTLQQKLKQ